jgi:NDP-sugar pyrophosphorylase family protein
MKIVIPLSGIGKRFLDAGYTDPKPLIEIEGRPMIYHVIDLFPGETDFHFICNEKHIRENKIDEILLKKVPTAKVYCVPNENRQGPVHAILQVIDQINIESSDEVIVSYCDFGTKWNYTKFLAEMHAHGADGGIAAYKGFHPHMLHGDNYAFMKEENGWMTDIQEKASFTDQKMNEYASNGIYYFRRFDRMIDYFKKLVSLEMKVNNEYYVSLVYKLMVQESFSVRIFAIEKMLQWGTPRDLEEYLVWSNYFHDRIEKPLSFRGKETTTLLLPMAGAGSRFFVQGFITPKPLLEVEGKPMVVQAVECLPPSKKNVFMCLTDHLHKYPLQTILNDNFINTQVVTIPNVTEGQACTCEIGLRETGVLPDEPILISACDNGVYYDAHEYYKLVDDPSVDVIVWSFINNPTSKLYPNMYAWLDVDPEGTIRDVSIKKPFADSSKNIHCIIGTMFFRRASIFLEGLQEIYEKQIRTNNEYYVDNVLIPLLSKYKVKVFEVKNYLCWGTPNDYKTYCYWNEYFESIYQR